MKVSSNQLKSLQVPIKDKYRVDPNSALLTLRAESQTTEGLSCKIQTEKILLEAGLHPATGGDGSQVCSGDMLLEALVACAGVTLKAVATSMDIDLKDAKVIAEADLDFRGTLGVSKEVPVGFVNLRLTFELDSDASDTSLDKLVELTERYCVVLQTIKHSPEISIVRSKATIS